MHIERVVLTNFQCFGPEGTEIGLEPGLTALIGANGSGKTAACQALRRMFGISAEDRMVRPGDFHVPADELTEPNTRTLRVEAFLAFPELDLEPVDGVSHAGAVPDFFHRMAAKQDGRLKCRIVLDATWEHDGTAEGAVTEARRVVNTFEPVYDDKDCVALPNAERARIQMLYIPASRDGARHASTFLRSRLWRAAQWSPDLREFVASTADELASKFGKEQPTAAVEAALGKRWGQLNDAGVVANPRFQPLEGDFSRLLRSAELVFEPGPDKRSHPAHMLSDGQRSLLHLALVAAALDLEAELAAGRRTAEFDITSTSFPNLTIVAVEEPENNLSPYFLSRIMAQLREISAQHRGQVLIASHSPGVLPRIEPEHIRHFRLDPAKRTAMVTPILLPSDGSDAGKFVREAVRAHPELYFAKFVILGEGDSEEIVLPRLARAMDIELDPSFVAMVPIGGRHSNHFFRLLNGLRIPHATLLDLDHGKQGAGSGRLRDVCTQLEELGIDVLAGLPGFDSAAGIAADLTLDAIAPILTRLRSHGVFFCTPLDLDHSMLTAFPDQYTKLEDGERGPQRTDPVDAVIGKGGARREFWTPDDRDLAARRVDELNWYGYLFITRSKPSSHLQALSRLNDEQLRNAPEPLRALLTHVQQELGR
ncbi:Chromosome partition protein Smc [Kutzneria sp. CA-103260]|nr:Chromosome partition protein Smc [Kutzneria sp. CA-103260]